MNDDLRKPESDDQLLDEAVVRLRDEHVPPVPSQLLEPHSEFGQVVVRSKNDVAIVFWLIGIAALVLAMVGIANMIPSQHDKPNLSSNDSTVDVRDNIDSEPTKIHVQNLTALRPYVDLERDIAGMKSEIEQLKVEAASLDAIRKANAMMAQN